RGLAAVIGRPFGAPGRGPSAGEARGGRGGVQHRGRRAPHARRVARRGRARDSLRRRDPVRPFAPGLPRSPRRGEGTRRRPARRVAQRPRRPPFVPGDGDARHLPRARLALGGMARVAPARPRAQPLAHAGHRFRHADGFHRSGSGVDGHGAGPPAMGDLRRPADVGRGDTHARPRRAISHVHAPVRLPRGDRGLAPVSTNPAESHDAGVERFLYAVGGRYVTLADLLAGVIFLALNAYALLGGADFGGGVWDLLATGPRKERQRELIAEAMGPVWEAKHVWLILALVLLFTCFPPAFARLGTLLHIPLSLVLIGIVLRVSAFTFWRYGGGGHGDPEQRHWGVVFAVASLITPL